MGEDEEEALGWVEGGGSVQVEGFGAVVAVGFEDGEDVDAPDVVEDCGYGFRVAESCVHGDHCEVYHLIPLNSFSLHLVIGVCCFGKKLLAGLHIFVPSLPLLLAIHAELIHSEKLPSYRVMGLVPSKRIDVPRIRIGIPSDPFACHLLPHLVGGSGIANCAGTLQSKVEFIAALARTAAASCLQEMIHKTHVCVGYPLESSDAQAKMPYRREYFRKILIRLHVEFWIKQSETLVESSSG